MQVVQHSLYSPNTITYFFVPNKQAIGNFTCVALLYLGNSVQQNTVLAYGSRCKQVYMKKATTPCVIALLTNPSVNMFMQKRPFVLLLIWLLFFLQFLRPVQGYLAAVLLLYRGPDPVYWYRN